MEEGTSPKRLLQPSRAQMQQSEEQIQDSQQDSVMINLTIRCGVKEKQDESTMTQGVCTEPNGGSTNGSRVEKTIGS